MKLFTSNALFFLLGVLISSTKMFAQDTDAPVPPPPPKPKILGGFYVGSYFANKYTASAYNGYGFDANGQRNAFANSWMHQKIINEYGGGYGQYDQIAQALGVDQNQWTFSESDMATNMHYTPAILVGFNFKIPLQKRNAIIFNFNGTKLNVQGNFTIETLAPQNPNPAYNNNVQIFTIKGSEQRLISQLGFQHLFGDDGDQIAFLLEGGFVGTLAKFGQNMIYINNLQIDLTNYVNQTLYPSPGPSKRPIGFGVGAYACAGVNVEMNPKFTLQLLYTASQERVNIGTNPTLKLQNGLGLRVYYKIRGKM